MWSVGKVTVLQDAAVFLICLTITVSCSCRESHNEDSNEYNVYLFLSPRSWKQRTGEFVLMRDQARQLLFMWGNVSHSYGCIVFGIKEKNNYLVKSWMKEGYLKTVLSLQLFEVEKNLINLHYSKKHLLKMTMVNVMGLGSWDSGPGHRTHIEFKEDYSKTIDVVGRFEKISVQLQSSSKYYEAVAEGISLLRNIYGMAGLDYLSL